jgi:hypothetical protein
MVCNVPKTLLQVYLSAKVNREHQQALDCAAALSVAAV